ncbi:MAG: hypothetical protein AAFR27_03995 [Pseudomonadota bacterium]
MSEKESRRFHYVTCDAFKALNIKLGPDAKKFERDFAALAVSSKRSIGELLKAVELSPFKTCFVVEPKSGEVLYAVTQNGQYAAAAKKKGGGGGRPPLPPSPAEECCAECMARGADGCMTLDNMACYCLFEGDGGGKGDIDTRQPAEMLGPM